MLRSRVSPRAENVAAIILDAGHHGTDVLVLDLTKAAGPILDGLVAPPVQVEEAANLYPFVPEVLVPARNLAYLVRVSGPVVWLWLSVVRSIASMVLLPTLASNPRSIAHDVLLPKLTSNPRGIAVHSGKVGSMVEEISKDRRLCWAVPLGHDLLGDVLSHFEVRWSIFVAISSVKLKINEYSIIILFFNMHAKLTANTLLKN